MTATYERRLQLTGSFNFRDLGGYETADGRSVRWRRLFRSDGLHRLTSDDIRQLRQLGLRRVFDLRSPMEIEHQGLGNLYEHGVLHSHVSFGTVVGPVNEQPAYADMAGRYRAMIERAQPAIKDIFSALAVDESYPAVFHCFAGKDRTGIVGALVLRTLGVSDEDIIADYALTDLYMPDRLAALHLAGEMDIYFGPDVELRPGAFRAQPEVMERLLESLDGHFGNTHAFVRQCGVSDEQLEAVCSQLLE